MNAALQKAKDAAGGTARLAEMIGGITPQAISQWKVPPAKRVLDIERATGVPRYELRPDLYPKEDRRQP